MRRWPGIGVDCHGACACGTPFPAYAGGDIALLRQAYGAMHPGLGNRRGINGGAFFFLRLSESGLEADLPVIGTFPATPQPDAGLLPDISAPLAAEAIAGHDRR